jgi:predicted histone-like DNA-binding protein
MKFRLIPRGNPGDPSAPKKLYAIAVTDGKITETSLAKDIAAQSSLTRGDVGNVITNIIDTIPKYLLMGKSVSLGELGTLRLSFSSEGVNEESEFNVGMIKGIKVVFTPSVALKEAIANLKFERD